MNLEELKLLLEKEISPIIFKKPSEVYGFHYSNSVYKKKIKKIMITRDLNLNSLHFAIKNKINLIISLKGLIHKPIIDFNPNLINKLSLLSKYPISIFVLSSSPNLINKLSLLSKYPISIFVLSSSFYAAEGGISDTIIEALFLKLDHPVEIKNSNGISIPIGRICIPNFYPGISKPFTLENLIERIRSNMNINSILYLGEIKSIINRICIIGGENFFDKHLDEILTQGCDCFITERVKRSTIDYLNDLGLNFIEIPFFNCEVLALKKLCNYLSLKFPYDEFCLFNSRNPLKLYTKP
jgi:putative NIF3 family GTP cyclohydrolase 1 type 2